MAISKVTLNGVTQMDVTQKTVTANTMLDGVTSLKNDGTDITGNIQSKTSSDLTVSGATVTAPAGNYASAASASVASGTAGTPTATKGTVSNHAISVTPSVTNTTGYITGGTKTGTAVSVSASELVSGTKSITSSGTTDVTNYASASVAAGEVTAPSSISATGATVSAGTNTLTLSKTVSNTPNVTTAGYISSGTAGNSSVSLTASVTTKAATTYHPSVEEQSISGNVYLTGAQTIAPVTTTNLNANNILRGVTVEVGDADDPDRVASVQGVMDVDVVVDPTLSVAGEAADAKATGDGISDVKNLLTDITGNVPIPLVANKYINLSGSSVTMSGGVPQITGNSSVGYSVGYLACSAGDEFCINGTGGESTRLWGFVNSSGTILDVAAANTTQIGYIMKAPANSAFIIVHTLYGEISFKNDVLSHTRDIVNRYNSYNILQTGWSREVNGITFTPIDDSYSVSGTATSAATMNLCVYRNTFPDTWKAGGSFVLYYNGYSKVRCEGYKYVNGTLNGTAFFQVWGDYSSDGYVVTIPNDATGILIRLSVPSGTAISTPVIVRPLILNALSNEMLTQRALPVPPTTNGTYTLQCVVSSGTPTYSWVSV